MGHYNFRLIILLFPLILVGAGCAPKGPVYNGEQESIGNGGGSGDTGGSTGTPRTVTISWAASHAKEVGLTGGGYKVYVKKGTVPSTTNTTPIVINNPGAGVHTTSTSLTLTSGRHYVVITSFTPNGDSVVSTTANVVVP